MKAAAIIPTRYGSTRLPGKALLDRTGKPLVVHVAESASRAGSIADLLVAADDQRIVDAVQAAGHRAVLTRADHVNGTTRIAEAAQTLDRRVSVIVNVQGDEPEIDPAVIDRLVERMAGGDEPDMATVVAPFAAEDDPTNPNVVKCVMDQAGRGLYFSRALIPHVRDPANQAEPSTAVSYLQHLGIYAYRREFLQTYVSLSPTPLEQAEKLEQLRALEHGYRIACVVAERAFPGVDTAEDYEAFVERWQAVQGRSA